jgi:hypothetical protein
MVWKKATPKANPGARGYLAMAYDSARQRMVMFGGFSLKSPLNGTWEYEGSTWVRRTVVTSPPVRGFHAMAYDAARRVVVMYGGRTSITATGVTLADTWEYDGKNWRQRQPKTSPPPLMGHAMVYDRARRMVVLFGGANSPPTTVSSSTWEYDGTNWRQRHMATAPARAHHGMVYDTARGVIVMTGGVNLSGQRSTLDPWELDGSRVGWVQRRMAGPGPFPSWCRMVYDEARQRTVWCGARYVGRGSTTHVAESWEWDGRAWRLRAGNTFPLRSWHAVAYDSTRKRAVLFGGGGTPGSGLSPDTWEYYPTYRGAATPVGAGCGGSAGIPRLTADGPPIMGNRDFRLRLDSARSNSSAFVVLALKPANLTVGGCTLFLDTSAPILIAGRSNGVGTLELPLSVPFNTALRGFRLEAQGFVRDPNGAFFNGLAFTNGLRLTFGD